MQRGAGQGVAAELADAVPGPAVGVVESRGGNPRQAGHRHADPRHEGVAQHVARLAPHRLGNLLADLPDVVLGGLFGELAGRLLEGCLRRRLAGRLGRRRSRRLGRLVHRHLGRLRRRVEAGGEGGDLEQGGHDLLAVVVGLHAGAPLLGQALGPQHHPQRLVRGDLRPEDVEGVHAHQPVEILVARRHRRRQAGVAAAHLEGLEGERLAGRGPDRKRLAVVAQAGQLGEHLVAVTPLVAVDLDDLVARGKPRVRRGRHHRQALVHLQRAHPGHPVVLLPLVTGGDADRQLPLAAAVGVAQGRRTGDSRAQRAFAMAEGTQVGEQGLIDLTTVVQGVADGAAGAEQQRSERDGAGGGAEKARHRETER